MPKFLDSCHYNEEEISRHLERKKNRIWASQNEWQQVCNRSNPEKCGRSCEGVDFSWLSSKVSWTLVLCHHQIASLVPFIWSFAKIVDTAKVGQIPSSIIVDGTNCELPSNQKPSRVCVNARCRLSDQARYICMANLTCYFGFVFLIRLGRGAIYGHTQGRRLPGRVNLLAIITSRMLNLATN